MNIYQFLQYFINMCVGLSLVYGYFLGIVLAHGWMKLVSIFFFPYGYYLIVEKYLNMC